MAGNGMFRTALFGGFNKEDVEEYINNLEHEIDSIKVLHQREKNDLIRQIEEQQTGISEEEIEKLQNEVAKLRKENSSISDLKEETEKLREENSRIPELREEIIKLRREHEENEDLRKQLEENESLKKQLEEKAAQSQDVQESTAGISEEAYAKLQKENDALREQVKQAEEAREKMSQNQDGEFFDYDTVTRIMEEARKNAAAIEEKSRVKAEQILEEARKETERQKGIIEQKINAQLEEKGIQLLAAKYKIEQYAKELDGAQQGLYNLNLRVKKLIDNMPVQLNDYWEGEHYRSLESKMLAEKTGEKSGQQNNEESADRISEKKAEESENTAGDTAKKEESENVQPKSEA